MEKVGERMADISTEELERIEREYHSGSDNIKPIQEFSKPDTQADIGIAIGAGTDVAMDAADVVLMKSKLSDVPAAIRLSRATRKNIRENLFWAFVYNIIGIPLATGVWIPLFGWQLNPMFGAAAMSLSSFCVVTNALRLNFKKI